jgi:predicted RNA-binding protein with RPS1 domain
VVEIDDKGKVRLSMKALIDAPVKEEKTVEADE